MVLHPVSPLRRRPVSSSTSGVMRPAVAPSSGVPLIVRFLRSGLPYFLALPIVVYEGIFIIYPMAVGVQFSLSNVQMGSAILIPAGLSNYQRLFSDSTFWVSLRTTLLFAFFVIVVALSVAMGAALLMDRVFRGRTAYPVLLTMPWAFPDRPTAIVFLYMLDQNSGVVGEIARWLPWV